MLLSAHVIVCLSLLVACSCANHDFLRALLSEPIVPQNNHSCPSSGGSSVLNSFHFRGTALGGWLIIEPWLTPSLFYQFLGCTEQWGAEAAEHVAIDSMTFCTALGPEEANRQLRNHWKTWVTEEQIASLSAMGVKHLRLPVGDWMYAPYEPYIGCWDGALDEVDRALALCEKYGIEVIIDLHAVKGSQNGLDNSGNTDHYTWKTTPPTNTSAGLVQYDHWDIRGGDWAGPFNTTSRTYTYINHTHLLETIGVIDRIIDRYRNSSVVIGLEPVNEPWQYIPMDVLQEFYWRVYLLVQAKSPRWITLMHDSFRLNNQYWGNANLTHPASGGSGFMQGCDGYAVDSHIYQAWADDLPAAWFEDRVCRDSFNLQYMERLGVPVVVGEWSLATDNCAMWLNGLNDNVPGYPKVECARIPCPASYLNSAAYTQPGTPLDPLLPARDPFGTGGPSYVEYGTCPVDRPFRGDDVAITRNLSYTMLHTYDHHTHGQFFWNFRTELDEPRWDYQRAVALGWIPSDWEASGVQERIADICVGILATKPPKYHHNDDDASFPTYPGMVMLSHAVSAALVFTLIVGAAYFIVQAFRGRCDRLLDGYEEIAEEGGPAPGIEMYPNNQRQVPISVVNLTNGDVETSYGTARTAASSSSDGAPRMTYPSRGNANHTSPYQAAIIESHPQFR